MNITIMSSIIRGIWAIEPEIGATYYPIVLNMLLGKQVELEADADIEPGYVQPGSYHLSHSGGEGVNPSRANTVAVLNINHVIFKYNQECGPRGTETYANWIQNLDNNPNVAGIILNIDSPGGEARAINNLAEVLKNTKKPVIAHISSGIAASAAYGIASQCREIYVSHTTDRVGSIGTYVTLADFKKYYESQGLPIHEIYATKSTKKNLDVRNAFKGDYKLIKQEIDKVNEGFIELVKSGRPNAKEEVFAGAMFFADEAKEMGLIDGVQSFKDTVDRIWQLAEEQHAGDGGASASVNGEINSSNTSEMKFESVAAMIAAVKAGEAVSADTLAAAEGEVSAALEVAGGELITQEEMEAARNEVPESATQQITQLEERIEELEAEASGEGQEVTTTAKPSEGGGEEASETDDLLTAGEQEELAKLKYQ